MRRIGIAGSLVGLCLAVPCMADVGASRADVDQVFAPWTGADRPGCALAVVEAGTVSYARGYGMANLETGTAISPDSIFDIGSLSKQFTAMAVVMLARDGKLSLDDDVRKYLPELPDYGSTITIRHLLHHVSGLRNYTDLFDLAGVPEVDLATTRDALELIARQRGVNFRPGEEFLYSDTNYFLAGEIVRRVSDQSLRDYSAAHIFKPLGMAHTHINDRPREVVPGRAVGYEPTSSGYLTYMSNFDMVGDGSVLTTVLDLAKWERNFAVPVVGGREAVDLLTHPSALNNGTATPYGMGVFVDQYRGLPWFHHDGEWVGYRAAISRLPTEQLSVIVTCNTLGALDAMDLALKVTDIYAAKHLAPAPTVSGARESATRHAGVYWSPERGTLRRFEARDGTLSLGGSGAGGVLERLDADTYRSRGENAALYRFRGDGSTGAAQLEVTSYGNAASYYRMPVREAPSSSLADYAGSFGMADLPVPWRLVVERGQLLRRQSYQQDTPLVPVFVDSFIGSLSEGDFLIHFVRDGTGSVTGLLVSGEMLRPMLLSRLPGTASQ